MSPEQLRRVQLAVADALGVADTRVWVGVLYEEPDKKNGEPSVLILNMKVDGRDFTPDEEALVQERLHEGIPTRDP